AAGGGARCGGLGVAHARRGIDDRLWAFEKLRTRLALSAQDCGFMGDELVDLPVLAHCGFACAPPEAREQVLARVHYVAEAGAGRGAAREGGGVVMAAQGTLERALQGGLA